MSPWRVLFGIVSIIGLVLLFTWSWATLILQVAAGHVPLWGSAVSGLLLVDVWARFAIKVVVPQVAKVSETDRIATEVAALTPRLQFTQGDTMPTRVLVDRDEVLAIIRREDA